MPAKSHKIEVEPERTHDSVFYTQIRVLIDDECVVTLSLGDAAFLAGLLNTVVVQAFDYDIQKIKRE